MSRTGNDRPLAVELFHRAYNAQMSGDLDLAVTLYQQSIQTFPTAEAYTFLGWTYRFQGRLDDAIAECKNAIECDPTLGNPYNDIGAYLIEQGHLDDAVPWLEQAASAERYDAYHYPWFNLARVHIRKEQFQQARACLINALEIRPDYHMARNLLHRLSMVLPR